MHVFCDNKVNETDEFLLLASSHNFQAQSFKMLRTFNYIVCICLFSIDKHTHTITQTKHAKKKKQLSDGLMWRKSEVAIISVASQWLILHQNNDKTKQLNGCYTFFEGRFFSLASNEWIRQRVLIFFQATTNICMKIHHLCMCRSFSFSLRSMEFFFPFFPHFLIYTTAYHPERRPENGAGKYYFSKNSIWFRLLPFSAWKNCTCTRDGNSHKIFERTNQLVDVFF